MIDPVRLNDLLIGHQRWWRLLVVPSQFHKDGRGWDVVLRIDGAYSERDVAEDVRARLVDHLTGDGFA